jgi:hypothetical protein
VDIVVFESRLRYNDASRLVYVMFWRVDQQTSTSQHQWYDYNIERKFKSILWRIKSY